MLVEILVRVVVAAGIHGYKAKMLKKPGVHTSTSTGVSDGDVVDDPGFEPIQIVLCRVFVHEGRRLAGIDWTAHQRHRQRTHGMVVLARGGDENLHHRLANGHDVDTAADGIHVGFQFMHVRIEVKNTLIQGNLAGVFPIRDVHRVAIRQHALDGVPQQGGVVAGQGRHNQYVAGVFGGGEIGFGEFEQSAEGAVFDRLLQNPRVFDRGIHARIGWNVHRRNAEFGLGVLFHHAVQRLGGALHEPGGEWEVRAERRKGPPVVHGIVQMAGALKQFLLLVVKSVKHR